VLLITEGHVFSCARSQIGFRTLVWFSSGLGVYVGLPVPFKVYDGFLHICDCRMTLSSSGGPTNSLSNAADK